LIPNNAGFSAQGTNTIYQPSNGQQNSLPQLNNQNQLLQSQNQTNNLNNNNPFLTNSFNQSTGQRYI